MSKAINLSRLISFPLESTTAARSTSVSKIIPKSALFESVAVLIAFIAALFSGFGIWFGNNPS